MRFRRVAWIFIVTLSRRLTQSRPLSQLLTSLAERFTLKFEAVRVGQQTIQQRVSHSGIVQIIQRMIVPENHVLADGARAELRRQNLQRRCAAGFDWREGGEKAGRRTAKKPGSSPSSFVAATISSNVERGSWRE